MTAPARASPQVYMFLVKWQDLSEKVVYRRFTEIYEFHVSSRRNGGGAEPPWVSPTLGAEPGLGGRG